MIQGLSERIFAIGWRVGAATRVLGPRQPVVLLYHGIPRQAAGEAVDARLFKSHMEFLKEQFEIIDPARLPERRPRFGRLRVLLTFDDGFRNNAEVVAPILRRHGIPAVFFVSSRHAARGKYLWFAYLRALENDFPGEGFQWDGQFWDMSKPARRSTIARLTNRLLGLRPHPAAMYHAIDEGLPRLDDCLGEEALLDRYAGMSEEQVEALARDPLFTVGAHTLDHPYLTWCSRDEMGRQILESKRWIERLSGKPCETVSYPIGDYDGAVLGVCADLGFKVGYAVAPRLKEKRGFEVERLGVYSPSLECLGFKVMYGGWLRAAGFRSVG